MLQFLYFTLLLVATTTLAADLPPPSIWCAISPCPVLPANLVAQANAEALRFFGPAAGTCGDGICDTSRLESCQSCPSDCGTCKVSAAVVKCTKPGVVALTFDDGSSDFTRPLVDLLQRENVKATFFVIGRKLLNATHAAATRYAYSAGHTIGSHTFTHRSMATSQFDPADPEAPKARSPSKPLSLDALRAEMIMTDLVIEAAIGVRPRLLRPPYLDTTRDALAWLETSGYVAVNINEDSNDWRLRDDPARATNGNVLTQVRAAHTAAAGAGSWILLQHDVYDYSTTAVASIIAFYRSQGIKFVSVDECLGERPYRPRGSVPYLNQALQGKVLNGPGKMSGPGANGDMSGNAGSSSAQASDPPPPLPSPSPASKSRADKSQQMLPLFRLIAVASVLALV